MRCSSCLAAALAGALAVVGGPVEAKKCRVEGALLKRLDYREAGVEGGAFELSGAAFGPDGALYSVGDDDHRVFRIAPDGKASVAFKTPYSKDEASFEGLAYDPNAKRWAIAREGVETIAFFDHVEGGGDALKVGPLQELHLPQLAGYDPLIGEARQTSGVEGISFSRDGRKLFLVKEKDPSLLITIALDPEPAKSRILSVDPLSCGASAECIAKGRKSGREPAFAKLDLGKKSLDVSGVQAVPAKTGEKLLIVSDRARALFLYDPAKRVYSVFPAHVRGKKKLRCAKDLEGIAYLPEADGPGRIVLLSDAEKGDEQPGVMVVYEGFAFD